MKKEDLSKHLLTCNCLITLFVNIEMSSFGYKREREIEEGRERERNRGRERKRERDGVGK